MLMLVYREAMPLQEAAWASRDPS